MEAPTELSKLMLELAAAMEPNPTMRKLFGWAVESLEVDSKKFEEWDRDTPKMEKLELDPLSVQRAKAVLVLMLNKPEDVLSIVAHLVQEHRRLSIAEAKRRKVH